MSPAAAEIRHARVALARALADPDSGPENLDEAERQYLMAVTQDAPDEPPPCWQLLAELAEISVWRGEPQVALGRLVDGVLEAPPESAALLSDRALRLVDSDRSGRIADILPAETTERLRELAHDHATTEEVVRLSARLSLARGEIAVAGDLIRQRDEIGDSGRDADLKAAEIANDVLGLLVQGELDAAEEHLRPVHGDSSDSGAALGRAFLAYARGDVAEAQRLADSHTRTGDLAIVAVLARLREAAESFADPNSHLYADAQSAASVAARNDPSGAAPILLRAQVLLEAGEQLHFGRDLLKTGLKRVQALDDIPWWRIQERYRSDERYRFFRMEVAARMKQPDVVCRLASDYSEVGTSFAQDGRVHELWATAAGSADETASHLLDAAARYRNAGDQSAVLRTLRQSYRHSLDPETGLQLVDALWVASYDKSEGSTADLIAEGLDLMTVIERQLPSSALASACLHWGLLLARRASATDAGTTTWEAVPHLALAVLLAPKESYSWAHLAWALSDADLWWPAARAAEHALHEGTRDNWLMETGVVTHLNWFADVSGELDEWLENVPSEVVGQDWKSAIRAVSLAVNGYIGDAAEHVKDLTLDTPWVRWIRWSVLALDGSIKTARPEISDYVELERKAGRPLEAASAALLLDADQALRLIGEATDGDAQKAAALAALVDLVRTDGQAGFDEAVADLRRTTRRYRLLQLRNIQFPLIVAAYPDRGGLHLAIERLSAEVDRRVAEMSLRPPLTAELDSGEVWCADGDLVELVRALVPLAFGDGVEPPAQFAPPETCGRLTMVTAWAALTERLQGAG